MKKINILFAIILMAGLVTLAHATQKITQICYQSGSRLICHNVQNNTNPQSTLVLNSSNNSQRTPITFEKKNISKICYQKGSKHICQETMTNGSLRTIITKTCYKENNKTICHTSVKKQRLIDEKQLTTESAICLLFLAEFMFYFGVFLLHPPDIISCLALAAILMVIFIVLGSVIIIIGHYTNILVWVLGPLQSP